tara:strand:- start:29 stop:625 length:597 start_codon:yes stop_codon:yes gene_type:complete
MSPFTPNPYSAYSKATHTVAKTKQVVMLYEGAIRFVQQAKEAIKENRIEDRYNLLVRASEILMGLQSCLDFEAGDAVARSLYDYYSYIDSRIMSVHRTNKLETCDEIIDELKRMRDVWNRIDKGETDEGEQAAAPAAPQASPAAAPPATGAQPTPAPQGAVDTPPQPPAAPTVQGAEENTSDDTTTSHPVKAGVTFSA